MAHPILAGERRAAQIPIWARARSYTEEALGVYVRFMRDEDAKPELRVACADRLIERGWGKAPIIVAGDEERPIKVEVSSMDSERLANIESALMVALGEGITLERLERATIDAAPIAPIALSLNSPADNEGLPEGVAGASPGLPALPAEGGMPASGLPSGRDER